MGRGVECLAELENLSAVYASDIKILAEQAKKFAACKTLKEIEFDVSDISDSDRTEIQRIWAAAHDNLNR
jgi:hypothetical protein